MNQSFHFNRKPMKKIILVLSLILFSFSLNAQIFDESDTISNRAKRAAQDLAGCELEITSNTPLENISREELDIGIRFNVFDNADLGSYSFTLENYDITFNMNMNKIIFLYGWIGNRHVFHDEYEGSSTEKEWHYQYYMFGMGWYIYPTIKIFGGTGQVIKAENDGKAPGYGNIFERGITFDKHVYGYKVEFTYRTVDVPISGDGSVRVEDAPAKGSFEAFSIGITAPFSLW